MSPRVTWSPPSHVWSQLGAVPVVLVDDLRDKATGERLAGKADLYARVIELDQDMPPDAMRNTLHHEALHMWLHDAGLSVSYEMEEMIVQSLATALTAQEDFVPPKPKRKRR